MVAAIAANSALRIRVSSVGARQGGRFLLLIYVSKVDMAAAIYVCPLFPVLNFRTRFGLDAGSGERDRARDVAQELRNKTFRRLDCVMNSIVFGSVNCVREDIYVSNKRKEKENYIGNETLPTSIKERGPHWCTDSMTSTIKFRLREARQAEKEDRSGNEKESKMIAERLGFQTFNKQSQHCQPSSPNPFWKKRQL
eukprot:882850-Pelagomonas_calceolata.AAC.3